ncbi:hypothetical protein BHE74_00046273 [Ensete ventricosum]|nr:hypothetical protein BHE74_00046273 [Ensete ventricosum]
MKSPFDTKKKKQQLEPSNRSLHVSPDTASRTSHEEARGQDCVCQEVQGIGRGDVSGEVGGGGKWRKMRRRRRRRREHMEQSHGGGEGGL